MFLAIMVISFLEACLLNPIADCCFEDVAIDSLLRLELDPIPRNSCLAEFISILILCIARFLSARWTIKESKGGRDEGNRGFVNRNMIATRNNPERGIGYGTVKANGNFHREKVVAVPVHDERASRNG